MGLPWFAMISDKNIRMNLNMLEKKPLTFFLIWAFLRQQSIRNWFLSVISLVCHGLIRFAMIADKNILMKLNM